MPQIITIIAEAQRRTATTLPNVLRPVDSVFSEHKSTKKLIVKNIVAGIKDIKGRIVLTSFIAIFVKG
jgi:hypothetical protein